MQSEIFLDAVKASMPEAAKLRAQSTLVSEEWNVEVVPYQYMTSKGGVCVAPKTAIPDSGIHSAPVCDYCGTAPG